MIVLATILSALSLLMSILFLVQSPTPPLGFVVAFFSLALSAPACIDTCVRDGAFDIERDVYRLCVISRSGTVSPKRVIGAPGPITLMRSA